MEHASPSPVGFARARVTVMRNIELTDIDAAWDRIGHDADAEPMALTVAQLTGLIVDPDDDPTIVGEADTPAVAAARAAFPPSAEVAPALNRPDPSHILRGPGAGRVVLEVARRIDLDDAARTIRIDEMPADFALCAWTQEPVVEPARWTRIR